MYGDLALDGEEVWALKKKGVLHWDGALWKSYSEPNTGDGASMVAGGGQVWILDFKGSFSHFHDGRWESHALELPGVNWRTGMLGGPHSRAQATASFGWSTTGFGGWMARSGPR